MADSINDELEQTQASATSVTSELERWSSTIDQARDRLGSLGDRLSSISGKGPMQIVTANASKEVLSVSKEVERLRSEVESMRGVKVDGESIFGGMSSAISNIDFDTFKSTVASSAKDAAKGMISALKEIQKQAADTDGALVGLATMKGAQAKFKAWEKIGKVGGFNDIQKQLRGIEKQAMQMGISMGDSFGVAQASGKNFLTSLNKTSMELFATVEQITNIRTALASAFSADEVSHAIDGLAEGFEGVESAITPTTVALNVARATGMSEAEVAKIMTEAHLELGSSLKDAALAFGTIRDAARESGLTYQSVSNSILGSAKTLKFFGGTMESVAPLFKDFNKSLRGIGREGLTPELFNTFIGQIERMSTSTRALLSLSSPSLGGPGVGVLGGALRVEEAMQTGEGMRDVAKSITETIKKFTGGGPILTRKEALESPASQRNYVIQRQILGTLTKISDPGQQNIMLQVLKDMEQGGGDQALNAEKSFAELLGAAEEVGRQTVTEQEKARIEMEAINRDKMPAIQKALGEILDALKITELGMAVSDVAKASVGGGATNLDTINNIVEGERPATIEELRKEADELSKSAKGVELTKSQEKEVGGDVGAMRAKAVVIEAMGKYESARTDIMRGSRKDMSSYEDSGVLTGQGHKEAWMRAQKGIVSRERDIGKQLKGKLSTQEREELMAERRALKDLKNQAEAKYRLGDNKPGLPTQDIASVVKAKAKERQERMRETQDIYNTATEGGKKEDVNIKMDPVEIAGNTKVEISFNTDLFEKKVAEIVVEKVESSINGAYKEWKTA